MLPLSQSITYPCQWFFGRHLENGGERATLVSDVENFMMIHFSSVVGGFESAEAGGFGCCFYVENFREADQGEYTSPYEMWLLRLLGQE